jgi:hypothetical protein
VYFNPETLELEFKFNFSHVATSYVQNRAVVLAEPLVISLTHRNQYYATYSVKYNYNYIGIGIMNNTHNTVNNLANPLVKPTDKVLKIVYDIVEV